MKDREREREGARERKKEEERNSEWTYFTVVTKIYSLPLHGPTSKRTTACKIFNAIFVVTVVVAVAVSFFPSS